MEAERPVPVVERLLEHRLDGEFTFTTPERPPDGSRCRGKADRLDLLADGTFRLIDYKLGWPPQQGARAAAADLRPVRRAAADGHRGRDWTLGEAVYLAFKGPKRVVPLFTAPRRSRRRCSADAQQRLVDAVDAIERGEFPPTPDDVFRCESAASRACAGRTTSATSFDAPTPRASRAVDPSQNVVLEASAGTGKTRVLVERYVNLLRAGVEPDHILAITFTRKAAAEMRQRIIERLKEASRTSQLDPRRGGASCTSASATSRSRRSTRSACRCCASFRSKPTSIPGFDLADDTEVPRLIGESLDRALRICRGIARADRSTSRWCSRSWASGGCATGWRRCSTAGWSRRMRCGGFSRAGRAT